jgi:hypothetical protein
MDRIRYKELKEKIKEKLGFEIDWDNIEIMHYILRFGQLLIIW